MEMEQIVEICYIDNVIQANILAAFSKNTKHTVYNVFMVGEPLEELIEKIYVHHHQC